MPKRAASALPGPTDDDYACGGVRSGWAAFPCDKCLQGQAERPWEHYRAFSSVVAISVLTASGDSSPSILRASSPNCIYAPGNREWTRIDANRTCSWQGLRRPPNAHPSMPGWPLEFPLRVPGFIGVHWRSFAVAFPETYLRINSGFVLYCCFQAAGLPRACLRSASGRPREIAERFRPAARSRRKSPE
jgi:hypothetical protein